MKKLSFIVLLAMLLLAMLSFASCDGETNDFLAMLKTHEYANQGGQKVIADPGKVFYIGETGGVEIPIMTDCDFGTQKHEAGDKCAFGEDSDDPKLYMDEPNFIIDDTIPELYPYSSSLPTFLKSGETCSTMKIKMAPDGSDYTDIRGVPVTKEEK